MPKVSRNRGRGRGRGGGRMLRSRTERADTSQSTSPSLPLVPAMPLDQLLDAVSSRVRQEMEAFSQGAGRDSGPGAGQDGSPREWNSRGAGMGGWVALNRIIMNNNF